VRPSRQCRDPQGRVGRVAPLLGQHTEEVLREAGFAAGRIAQLLARGVIVQASASG